MLTVIDYGLGNLFSVFSALKFLSYDFQIDTDGKNIDHASLLIIPGVASFESGISNLIKRNQFEKIRNAAVKGVPVIGLCLGAQMLLSSSAESPGVDGLDLVEGCSNGFTGISEVRTFQGWAPVFTSESNNSKNSENKYFYFSHSYHMDLSNEKLVTAQSFQFDLTTTAIFHKDNLIGAQFHPERSGKLGLVWLDSIIHSQQKISS